jgi:hypothetical protein
MLRKPTLPTKTKYRDLFPSDQVQQVVQVDEVFVCDSGGVVLLHAEAEHARRSDLEIPPHE